ncbi:MAG: hypothetical protein ACEQSB_06380 [Undibacterium sp.]
MHNHKGPWTLHEGMTHMTVRNNETDSVFFDLKSVPGVREDARLIAAAPCMLEALKYALEEIESLPQWPDEVNNARHAIIRAIAKAEGGE